MGVLKLFPLIFLFYHDIDVNKLNTLSHFFMIIGGSYRNSLCTTYTLSHPTVGWSSPHWFEHSPTSWLAKIWGNLSVIRSTIFAFLYVM